MSNAAIYNGNLTDDAYLSNYANAEIKGLLTMDHL